MGWMLFFMLVVLKIPLAAACWLVWYAIKAEPELDEEPSGGEDRGPRRKLPAPRPRAARRRRGCSALVAQEAPPPERPPALARRQSGLPSLRDVPRGRRHLRSPHGSKPY